MVVVRIGLMAVHEEFFFTESKVPHTTSFPHLNLDMQGVGWSKKANGKRRGGEIDAEIAGNWKKS